MKWKLFRISVKKCAIEEGDDGDGDGEEKKRENIGCY